MDVLDIVLFLCLYVCISVRNFCHGCSLREQKRLGEFCAFNKNLSVHKTTQLHKETQIKVCLFFLTIALIYFSKDEFHTGVIIRLMFCWAR